MVRGHACRTAEGKPFVLESVKQAEAELLVEQREGKLDKVALPHTIACGSWQRV